MPLTGRPRLQDSTVMEWIDKRADELDIKYPDKPKHLRGEHFINMVGGNPARPKVDVTNLAKAFDASRGAVYHWLGQMKREMGV